MGKSIIIIILFLLLFKFSFSQNGSGIIKYDVSLNFTIQDIEKEEKKQNKRLTTMRELISNARSCEVVLTYSSTYAYSSITKRMKLREKNNKLDIVYSRAGREKTFFTELITKSSTVQECKLLEECFLIEQPVLKWELTQETKLVGGYICYKAINTSSKNKKKKPVAWYTPQIPASYGPKHYFGLPGLILELEETAVVFKVKEIILNPKEEVKVIVKEGTKITQEEYNKKLKKAFTQFYEN